MKTIEFNNHDFEEFISEISPLGYYYKIENQDYYIYDGSDDSLLGIFKPKEQLFYSDYINDDGIIDLEYDLNTIDLDPKMVKYVKQLLTDTMMSRNKPTLIQNKDYYIFSVLTPMLGSLDEGFLNHMVNDAIRVISFNLEIDSSLIISNIINNIIEFKLPAILFVEPKYKHKTYNTTFRYKLISDNSNKSLQWFTNNTIIHDDLISKLISSIKYEIDNQDDIDIVYEITKISYELFDIVIHRYQDNYKHIEQFINDIFNEVYISYKLLGFKLNKYN